VANENQDNLKYPIGRYQAPAVISPDIRAGWIEQMAVLPANFSKAVAGLNDAQLDTPYRPGGWTVRQVVHHVPDSHMNSYMRFRLALTEDVPLIKPYEEAAWAKLSDAHSGPVAASLMLLDGLHQRFVLLLRSPSRTRRKTSGLDAGPLCLAFAAPYRAHYQSPSARSLAIAIIRQFRGRAPVTLTSRTSRAARQSAFSSLHLEQSVRPDGPSTRYSPATPAKHDAGTDAGRTSATVQLRR